MMNNMNNVAFGAGKAGTGFDPITYLMKPQVILRIICWLCSLIVWACISMNAWTKKGKKEVCLFNSDNAACRFGSVIGFIGFLGAIAFLGLEAMFSSLSSIKLRRRAVMVDMGFSAAWAALSLFVFGYLAIAWSKSDYPPLGQGINNCRAAIAFSFFAIAAWGACAYLAYMRWQQGADMTQFTSGFDPSTFQQGDMSAAGAGYAAAADIANYSSYAGDTDPNYQSNPFTAIGGAQDGNFQTPAY